MARSAVSAVQNPSTLWAACQQTPASQKWSPLFRLSCQFCRDIIHYNVGACTALSQRWAGAVTVLRAENRLNAKHRLSRAANSLLLSGYVGLALDGAGTWALVWPAFSMSRKADKSCIDALNTACLSLQAFTLTLLVICTKSNWLLLSYPDLFLHLTSIRLLL